MIVDVQKDEPPDMTPDRFFAGLQAAARYVIDRGLPFFTKSHITFMEAYWAAWGAQDDAEAEAVNKAREDLDRLKKETRLDFSPMRAQLLGFVRSVFSSAWMVLGNSIRIVPPLITAVVVVFVTSDGWRILGTGFTPRTIFLVVLFLVTSLVFLIRFKGYWEDDWDISASCDIQEALLTDIQAQMEGDHERAGTHMSSWQQFNKLIDRGAKTVPLVKPVKLGAGYASTVAI